MKHKPNEKRRQKQVIRRKMTTKVVPAKKTYKRTKKITPTHQEENE